MLIESAVPLAAGSESRSKTWIITVPLVLSGMTTDRSVFSFEDGGTNWKCGTFSPDRGDP
jgi:hypothetical protein